jgi:hypothetical protein
VREGGTEPWLCRTSAFSLINRLGNWVVVTFFFFFFGTTLPALTSGTLSATSRGPPQGPHLDPDAYKHISPGDRCSRARVITRSFSATLPCRNLQATLFRGQSVARWSGRWCSARDWWPVRVQAATQCDVGNSTCWRWTCAPSLGVVTGTVCT